MGSGVAIDFFAQLRFWSSVELHCFVLTRSGKCLSLVWVRVKRVSFAVVRSFTFSSCLREPS